MKTKILKIILIFLIIILIVFIGFIIKYNFLDEKKTDNENEPPELTSKLENIETEEINQTQTMDSYQIKDARLSTDSQTSTFSVTLQKMDSSAKEISEIQIVFLDKEKKEIYKIEVPLTEEEAKISPIRIYQNIAFDLSNTNSIEYNLSYVS